MARAVTINRPDVVKLIELAATKLTHGNKTEAVRLAMDQLLETNTRKGSLFGMLKGTVRVKPGVDLTQPILDDPMDAEILPWAANLDPDE